MSRSFLVSAFPVEMFIQLEPEGLVHSMKSLQALNS